MSNLKKQFALTNGYFFAILTFFVISLVSTYSLFIYRHPALAAADCGDTAGGGGSRVVCACGDNVVTDYTMTADLSCSGNGLTIGASGITFDGQDHTITNTIVNNRGANIGISGTNFNNITIQNLNIVGLFKEGIYLTGAAITNININNVSVTESRYAIHLQNVTGGTINLNTITNADMYAFYVINVNNMNFTNNTILYSGKVFAGANGAGNLIDNNSILRTRENGNLFLAGTNTQTNNEIIDSEISRMIAWTDISRTYDVGDEIDFSFDLKDYLGNACPTCAYTVSVSPSETITQGLVGNTVTGSFTANYGGTYGLQITITDPAGNYFKKNYIFLIGDTDQEITRFYYTKNAPAHGQGTGTDDAALVLNAPITDQQWQCDQWVGNAVDNIPDYPVSILDSVDYEVWYRNVPRPIPTAAGSGNPNTIVLQKFAGYNFTYEYPTVAVYDIPFYHYDQNPADGDPPYEYALLDPGTKTSGSFTSLNIPMDYGWSWYKMELKFIVQTFNDGSGLQTFTADPSYADFTYTYALNPIIKTISNSENFTVLSAIYDPADPLTSHKIVLEGTGDTDLVLSNFSRVFSNYQTIIDDDNDTATVKITGASGLVNDINALNFEIYPDSGAITVDVIQWLTSGAYTKEWVEEGSLGTIHTGHTIGDLLPNSYYSVQVTPSTMALGPFMSNASGEISFDYTGGYSTKTFKIVGIASSSREFEGEAGILINNDALSTNSQNASLALNAPQAVTMLLSNNADFAGAEWEAYTEEKSWLLSPSYGVKTVYAIFRNNYGNDSATVSDSIEFSNNDNGADTGSSEETPEDSQPTQPVCTLPSGLMPGDLIKMPEVTTVYLIDRNNSRRTFPNESTYFTWYSDFSKIKTIDAQTISQICLGKNMTVRPGTALVKIQTVTTVYAIGSGAILLPISDAEIANKLYGPNWATLVIDIPDAFFVNYEAGEPMSNSHTTGSLIQYNSNPNIYYIDNKNKRLVTPDIFLASGFQEKYIIKNLSEADYFYETLTDLPYTPIQEYLNY